MKQTQIILPLTGMHCVSCASTIKQAVSELQGVQSVAVSYAHNTLEVHVDENHVTKQDIIRVVESLGYGVVEDEGSHDHMRVDAQQEKIMVIQLVVGIFASVLLIIGAMVPWAPEWLRSPYTMFVLATPVQFWLGWRYYMRAWRALRNYTATMDTLIALGTTVAYGYSVLVLFAEHIFHAAGIPPHVYFESSAVIITFILLGNYLELRARTHASQAVMRLMNLQPQQARKYVGDEATGQKNWKMVSVAQLSVDDILQIKPGEQIPLDGTVTTGESVIDQSMVTGESVPVTKKQGDTVIGGTINTTGSFEMRVTQPAGSTMLDRIIALVQAAQRSKAPIENLVDRISAYFVPGVIGAALLSGVAWLMVGPEPALLHAVVVVVAVLIIACPCALGLATPTAVTVGMGRGAQEGMVIKDMQTLEIAGNIDVVLFDKTGTITEGTQRIVELTVVDDLSKNFAWLGANDKAAQQTLFSLMNAVEELSSHPISVAVTQYLVETSTISETLKVEGFENLAGLGIRSFFDKHEILIGSQKLIEQQGATLPKNIKTCIDEWLSQAYTVSFVMLDGQLVAYFCIADVVRDSARATIAQLKALDITPVMLTGDNQQSAEAIAALVGIEQVVAQVVPEEKHARVEQFRTLGNIVAMVGDGINDAPALAAADVGIAVGSGTDIALESANVALLNNDIARVIMLIHLSRATMRTIKQNLIWAFGYNIVLIPVAMGVLYPLFGITLTPMVAGAAMALSSVSVVLNALRLYRVKLVH